MNKATKKQAAKKTVGGPFLTLAVFCERSMQERDGVQSLVRMFDRLTVPPLPVLADPTAKAGVQVTFVVGFKSGDFVGPKTLRIKRLGKKPREHAVPVVFEGQEHGPVVVSEMRLQVTEPELIWFEVYLDEQLMTHVPLRILFAEEPSPSVDSSKKKTRLKK